MRRRLTEAEWARVAGPIVANFVAVITEFSLDPLGHEDFGPELQRRYVEAGKARDPEALRRACRAMCGEAYQQMLASETKEAA